MNNRSAFSLVELSIVLVILGLLTGGILTGQNLIRAAELRSIVTEKDKYIAALQTFRSKYNALPGDLSNALQFWGSGDATPLACEAVTGAPSYYQTCNGNGDGFVGKEQAPYKEPVQLWRHLALSGMIEGDFSGETISGTTYYDTTGPWEKNILNYYQETTPVTPKSRARNMRWYTGYVPNDVIFINFAGMNGSSLIVYPYNHYLMYGLSINDSGASYKGALEPREAWNIDKKVDDGSPVKGNLIVFSNTHCVYNGEYLLTETHPYSGFGINITNECGLVFANAY